MATAELELTNSYQLVSTASDVLITLEQGKAVYLHEAASLPLDTAPAHTLLRGTDRTFWNYTGSNNIYAKKTDPANSRTVKISYTLG
jgi:hypothetical protein